MNWELSRGVILYTELNSPLKIVPHWITAHGLACIQGLLNSVEVFQMTTVRAGLSPQSKTRYFRRKFKKKKSSFIPFSDTVAKTGGKYKNGQVSDYKGNMNLLLHTCEKKLNLNG